jgi:hypothetical protein
LTYSAACTWHEVVPAASSFVMSLTDASRRMLWIARRFVSCDVAV